MADRQGKNVSEILFRDRQEMTWAEYICWLAYHEMMAKGKDGFDENTSVLTAENLEAGLNNLFQ